MTAQPDRQAGFTVIEIIAVLVILGTLAAVAIPKFQDLIQSARRSAISAGIAEYSARESQLWAKYMLDDDSPSNDYEFDREIYDNMDPYLDGGYSYDSPGSAGEETDNWYYVHQSYGNAKSGTPYSGYLEFQGERAYVKRAPATHSHPAYWWIDHF